MALQAPAAHNQASVMGGGGGGGGEEDFYKLHFRQNYVDVSRLPLRKNAENFLGSNRRSSLKESFPTVLNKLSYSNNHRSRDTAFLGVVNATERKQKSTKGDSHICRPSEEDTPPNFVPFFKELEVEHATKFHQFLRSDKHYRIQAQVRARMRVVGNFTHAQMANSLKKKQNYLCSLYFFGLQKIPLDKCHVMSNFRNFSLKEIEENQNKGKINAVNNLSLKIYNTRYNSVNLTVMVEKSSLFLYT